MKLMTHVVAGYPNLKECQKIAIAMAESGAKFLEIQIPFSDPIADGPTIMEANEKALENNIKVKDVFKLIENLKTKIQIPILIMTYYNIVHSYGLEKFCKQCAILKVYGLIIPDISLNEEKSEHYIEICKKNKLHPIQIIAPNTSEKRLEKISKVASGFVYCMSSFGTTGERKNFDQNLNTYLQNVRGKIKIPIAIGFGISTKTQAKNLSKICDIIVIGSKIINLYNENKSINAIKNFIESITAK